MQQFITLGEVLNHLDSGQPFSIVYTTCSLKRGTGGQVKSYMHCVKHMNQVQNQKEAAKTETLMVIQRKNPNHYKNSTRNIFLTKTREVKTVYIRLINFYNGKQVS